jgi:hypothetical protein
VTLATVRAELARLVDELEHLDDDGPRLLAESLRDQLDLLLVDAHDDGEPDVFGRRGLERRAVAQREANARLRRRVEALEMHRHDLERCLALACELAGRAANMGAREVLSAVLAIDHEREAAYSEMAAELRGVEERSA